MNLDEAISILELPSLPTEESLKIQFRIMAIKYHPDKNKEHNATNRFIKIKQAYDILLKEITKPYINSFNVQYYPRYTMTTGNTFNWTFTNG